MRWLGRGSGSWDVRRPGRLRRLLEHPDLFRRPGRPFDSLPRRSLAAGPRRGREGIRRVRQGRRIVRADDRAAPRDARGNRVLPESRGRRRDDDGLRGDPGVRTRDSLRLALHRRQSRPRDRRRAPDVRSDPQHPARERRADPDRRRQGTGAPSMSILIKDVDVGGRATHLYIEGDRIAEIGKRRAADTVLDGRGKIALPGFVNLHTHAAMTLFRGYADDLDLSTWLGTRIWPAEAKLSAEDVYWGTKLACLEMIKSGTTTFNDMYFHMDGAAKAVKDMGLRAFLAEGIVDLDDPDRAAKQFRAAEEANCKIEDLKTHRIRPAFGPHAIYTVSKDSLLRIRELADKRKSLIHIHLSETKHEVDECLAKTGASSGKREVAVGVRDRMPPLGNPRASLHSEAMALRARKARRPRKNPARFRTQAAECQEDFEQRRLNPGYSADR